MNPSFTFEQIEKLIPVLTEKQKQEIILFHQVYEKYENIFSRKKTDHLKGHPVFGKLSSNIPKEVSQNNDRLSFALQHDAIIHNNWKPYIEYHVKKGIGYAKMGIDFKSWFDLNVMMKHYITPFLHREYNNSEAFLSSLNGMTRFLDFAMAITAEAYLQEKKGVILKDHEEIKKLNEELEQKVINRTAALQKSNDLFFYLFDFNPAIIIISQTNDDKIVKVNDTFLQLFGFSSRDDVVGKTFQELNILSHPEQRNDIAQQLKDKITLENYESEVRNKNGSPVWLSSTYKKIDFNSTACIFSVSIDITERKKIEEQLKLVNRELEAFSYSVSHDLHAPLRVIKGIAHILNKKYASKLDADGISMLDLIMDNAKKMGDLITSLLEFSKLGLKELTTSEIDMTSLVLQIIKEQEQDLRLDEIEFTVHVLPAAKADKILIGQVWFNLISNAIKYSKHTLKRRIEIGSFYEDMLVVYYVKDNGAGFDMAKYEQLFGVFHRLHTQEEFEGTGIGLANVKRIINHHGGTVWATSTLDEGACFYFSLPGEPGSLHIT